MKHTLAVLATLACSRERATPTVQADPTPSATHSVTAVSPALIDLPLCKRADRAGRANPLGAICAVGADAKQARFGCDDPHPYRACAKGDLWSCKTGDASDAPHVSYTARFDRPRAELRDGKLIEAHRREGPVRSVGVYFYGEDDKASATHRTAIAGELLAGPCKETDARFDYQRTFDCGGWSAIVSSNSVEKFTLIEVAQIGFLKCE